jgi:hypothetical protein
VRSPLLRCCCVGRDGHDALSTGAPRAHELAHGLARVASDAHPQRGIGCGTNRVRTWPRLVASAKIACIVSKPYEGGSKACKVQGLRRVLANDAIPIEPRPGDLAAIIFVRPVAARAAHISPCPRIVCRERAGHHSPSRSALQRVVTPDELTGARAQPHRHSMEATKAQMPLTCCLLEFSISAVTRQRSFARAESMHEKMRAACKIPCMLQYRVVRT